MKRLILILCMLWGVAVAQPCADEDTVRSNTVTLITYNSARINGSISHFAAAYVSIQLKYVRVGQTDTVTSTGLQPLRNITGLQASTLYYYRYVTICATGTRSQTGIRTFTTLAATVNYTPMDAQGYQWKYGKFDSGLIVPRRDTGLDKSPNIGGQIKFRPSDSLFYGYNGRIWAPLAVDSSGIIALLDGKVDSVTASGYQIFYWKSGVPYGFTIETETDGNLLYVDDVNGNDGTAEVNKPDYPYLTLAAAKADATAGATVIVRPGTYSISASLAKDEVDWYFQPGASVTFANDLVTTGIWDDGGTSMQFKVKGSGKFTRSSTDDVLAIKTVNVTHASSDIIIEADQLICTAGDNAQASVIYQTAGLVDINSRLITGTGGSMYAVWWFNGDMYIKTSKLYSDYSGFVSDVSATPTGDANIQAFEIATTVAASSTGIAVGNTGANADAAFWVHANIITGKVQSAGLNKLYVECQKIIGTVESTPGAGLIYVTADKIVDAGEGMIEIGAGTARINVDHLDPATFNGDIVVSAGILYLNGADYVSSATSDGLTISGGTAILTDVNINTAANASTFPITKSGGTLTLRNNILTGEGTVNGISAPTSQTVISYGSVSNRPLDSDVILSGNMTVNSLSYNSNIASGVGTRALRYNPTTEQITYADTTAAGGSSVALSAITAATGANSINNVNNLQAWNWNSFTAGNNGLLLNANSSSVGASGSALFQTTLSGANPGSGTESFTAGFGNIRTGTGSINTAAAFNAYNGSENFAAKFQQGKVQFGFAASQSANIELVGLTSGKISLKVQDAAGTYNWNWPTTAGTSGHLLTSGGGGSSPIIYTDPATFALASSIPELVSGTFTPTISGEVNGAVTSHDVQYIRVGNTVTVSGGFEIDFSSGSTPTEFRMDLPVTSSNFANAYEAGGTADTDDTNGGGMRIYARVSDVQVIFSCFSLDNSSHSYSFSFTYKIIP